MGPVSNTNGTLSYTTILEGLDLACQRALTVANNVVIDVQTCSRIPSNSQSGSAVNIAHQIAAKVPAYGPQVTLPFTGLSDPDSVAVDTAGDLYVVDHFNNRVLKLAAGSATQTVLPFTGLESPHRCGGGHRRQPLRHRQSRNRSGGEAGGGRRPPRRVLPFTGLDGPDGVAVDTAGNVYVTDATNARVVKLAAGSSTQTVLPFTGLNDPHGVAVDTAGNLYVTDRDNNRVLKLAAGSSTQTVLPFTGLAKPTGVAVDAAGNLYVTDMDNRVVKLSAG